MQPSPDRIHQAALRLQSELADERTPHQDPAFGFRQLVDIAERALSPAVNDPSTAVQALDEIHDLLSDVEDALAVGVLDIGDHEPVLGVDGYPDVVVALEQELLAGLVEQRVEPGEAFERRRDRLDHEREVCEPDATLRGQRALLLPDALDDGDVFVEFRGV